MKIQNIIVTALAAAMLAACGTASPIGLVDVQRIVSNWQEYQNDQTQMLGEQQSIASRKGSTASKERAEMALEQKYAKITDQLTQQIRDAATKIAQQRRLKLVVTREGVGYGGVDITSDIEKSLNITEKASPAPSGS